MADATDEGDDRLRIVRDGGLVTLVLSRGGKGNALDARAGRELRDAALACAMDPSVRAVLLTADGPNFCVGGDMGHLLAQADVGLAVRAMTTDFHAAILLLARMDAPLVCAVQGAAAGAGLSLAAVADHVVASQSASFAYAYTRVGLSADGGLTWTLPRLIGLRRFQSLYLTGRRLSAAEALEWGVVSEVVDDDALGARALEVARQLASGPTGAYGAVKRLAASSFDHGLEAQLESEIRALTERVRSPEAAEAIAALMSRRTPAASGR